MSRGILIGDKHTFNDWGLILTSADIGYPMPKTEYIDIPHGDGSIDLTEALTGEVKYSNREGTFEFDLIADPNERVRVMNEIASYLHGKVHTIVLPDEPDFIYIGRLSINQLKTSYMLNKLVINAVSNPYKLKPDATTKELRLVENLIPNGWDSFEPYGSGKNYVDNWDFTNDDMSMWGNYSKNKDNTISVDYGWSCRQDITLPKGEYQVRVKHKLDSGKGEVRVSLALIDKNIITTSRDEWHVHESVVTVDEDVSGPLYILEADRTGGVVRVDWIQITPVDNQHLVVEKTPLENGLTRIQTWGGNSNLKLRFRLVQDLVETNTSLYIVNKGERMKISRWVGSSSRQFIESGEEKFISFNQTATIENTTLGIDTDTVDDNLDFIASDPFIYEEAYGGELPLPTDEVGGIGTGVAKVILKNEMKKVIPKVTTDKEITLKYGEVEININAGTHLIPQLELQSGDNVIYIRGEVGTNVRFEYQEEGL